MGRCGKIGWRKGPALVFVFLGIVFSGNYVLGGDESDAEDVVVGQTLLQSMLDQAATPPIDITNQFAARPIVFPPFSSGAVKKYISDPPNPNSPLRKAVKNARVLLWAIHPGKAPKRLRKEVAKRRGKIRIQLNVLKNGYPAPQGGGIAEKNFKRMVEADQQRGALVLTAIDDVLDQLQTENVYSARKKECPRWKANYDLVLACVHMERAYLFEYQSMLGCIRKEFPPCDPKLHSGWKLVSQVHLQGDSDGKKSAKIAQKLLDKIIDENAHTPWEVLAKRAKNTNLGLHWEAVK